MKKTSLFLMVMGLLISIEVKAMQWVQRSAAHLSNHGSRNAEDFSGKQLPQIIQTTKCPACLQERLEKDSSDLETYIDGFNALHWAVIKKYAPFVTILIEAGANIHAKTQNENPESTLCVAIRHRHGECADILIRQGARVNEKAFTVASHAKFKLKSLVNDILKEEIIINCEDDPDKLQAQQTPPLTVTTTQEEIVMTDGMPPAQERVAALLVAQRKQALPIPPATSFEEDTDNWWIIHRAPKDPVAEAPSCQMLTEDEK